MIALAWFRRNVAQRWSPCGRPGTRFGMYFLTVRGQTRRPQFEEELIRDAFLTPERILSRHKANQPTQFQWNGWAARSRLVAPQQSPPGSVPSACTSGYQSGYFVENEDRINRRLCKMS
jgi:hypothetical protein